MGSTPTRSFNIQLEGIPFSIENVSTVIELYTGICKKLQISKRKLHIFYFNKEEENFKSLFTEENFKSLPETMNIQLKEETYQIPVDIDRSEVLYYTHTNGFPSFVGFGGEFGMLLRAKYRGMNVVVKGIPIGKVYNLIEVRNAVEFLLRANHENIVKCYGMYVETDKLNNKWACVLFEYGKCNVYQFIKSSLLNSDELEYHNEKEDVENEDENEDENEEDFGEGELESETESEEGEIEGEYAFEKKIERKIPSPSKTRKKRLFQKRKRIMEQKRSSQNVKVLTVDDIIDIIIQICLGLQYLRRFNYIHIDLKVSNIVGCFGKPSENQSDWKIADYGLSRICTYTKDGYKIVAPEYIAPELLKNHKIKSNREDIYSLGILMWECLEGEKAWGDYFKAYSDIMTFAKKIHIEKFPLEFVRLKDYKDIQKLIMDCRNIDPLKRPDMHVILRTLVCAKYKISNENDYLKRQGIKKYDDDSIIIQKQKVNKTVLFELFLVTSRKTLYLEYCKMNVDDEKVLKRGIASNCTIENLYLGNNNFKGNYLAMAFEANTCLKRVFLMSNKIDDEGMMKISKVLRDNKTIEEIDFSNNLIGNQGVAELASALKVNKTLKFIDLSSNSISDDGAIYLRFSLMKNKTLKELSLKRNKIKNTSVFANKEELSCNIKIKSSLYVPGDFQFY